MPIHAFACSVAQKYSKENFVREAEVTVLPEMLIRSVLHTSECKTAIHFPCQRFFGGI